MEKTPLRSLTAGEAEELTQHLTTRFSDRDFSRHTEEQLTNLLIKATRDWYDSKDMTCPDPLRVVINPGNELWVDVGYLICARQTDVQTDVEE